MIVWGWGGRTKDRGPVAPWRCATCDNVVIYRWVHTNKTFKLYWIPVVPYDSKEYLVCPRCLSAIEVPRENLPALQLMIQVSDALASGAISEEDYAARSKAFWRTLGFLGSEPEFPSGSSSALEAERQVELPTPTARGAVPSADGFKLCPACAEEIRAAAIKCRWCETWLAE